MEIDVYSTAGEVVGKVALDETVWNVEPNIGVMHQALLMQQANARQGTHDTKTRSEVRGGGKKPWRQKGTGRARQGSTRAPQWRHGGVVFGPHPRDYSQDMPRKARRAAVRSLLTSKVTENRLRVLDQLQLDEGKTKRVVALLSALNVEGKAIISMGANDENTVRAARNLPGVKTMPAANLNALDLLDYDTLILTREGIDILERFLA